MKNQFGRIGIRSLGFAWLYFSVICAALAADTAGVVAVLNGTLTAKGPDGALRVLAAKAEVSAGDTLFVGRDSNARIKFADGGEIALRQDTHFKIEDYHYNEKLPDKDSAGFNLLKGGLRALSGLVGKRGNPDSYRVKTQAATAGIRGTIFGVLFCQNDCDNIQTADGKIPENGMHVDVEDGAVIVKNDIGSQVLHKGEFGYTKDFRVAPAGIPPQQGVRVPLPPQLTESWTKISQNKDEKKTPTRDLVVKDVSKEAPKNLQCPIN